MVVEPYGPSFPAVIEKLGQDPSVQVIECPSCADALSISPMLDSALFLSYAPSFEAVSDFADLLKSLKKEIRARKFRAILTTAVRDVNVVNKLGALGCSEIIAEPIAARVLSFKIDHHLKLVSPVKKAEDSAPPKATTKIEPKVVTRFGDIQRQPKVQMVPPVPLESDCWINEGFGARVIGGKWVIKLVGPSPVAGKWLALPQTETSGELLWQWTPHDPERDPYIKEEGSWIFRGNLPKFQEDSWTFIAKRPDLSFFYSGENYGSKISVDQSGLNLNLAQNSKAAVEFLPQIRDSLRLGFKVDESKSERAVGKQLIDKSDELREKKAAKKARELQTQKTQPQTIVTTALTLESDCWLIEERRARKIGNQWMVKLKGPSNVAGFWQEIESDQKGQESFWQWAPQDPANDPFSVEEGAWVFQGQTPRFEEGLWTFVGKNCNLSFYYDGQAYGTKIQAKNAMRFEVAMDSKAAKAFLPLIQNTLKSELTSRKPSVPTQAPVDDLDTLSFFKNESATPSGVTAPQIQGIPSKQSKTDFPEAMASHFAYARPPVDFEVAPPRPDRTFTAAPESPEVYYRDEAPLASNEKFFREERPQTPDPDIQAFALPTVNTGGIYVLLADPDHAKPSLSPIAVAFLISEMARNADLNSEEIARKICATLNLACFYLTVEIWEKRGRSWEIWVGSDPEHTHFEKYRAQFENPELEIGTEIRLARIDSGTVLVMGGTEVQKITEVYLQACAMALRGTRLMGDETLKLAI